MSAYRNATRTTIGNLKPARGSQHTQKRLGRGQGSHHGGTSGRGENGQKARSGGNTRPGFEGGQTSFVKKIPKRGFVNFTGKEFATISVRRIQSLVQRGRLSCSPEHPITVKELYQSGCMSKVLDGVKLLGDGSELVDIPLYISPSRASQSAIKAIESHGGSVVCRYYTPKSLRASIKGEDEQQKDPAPARRTDIEWYTDSKNRGYLAPEIVVKLPDSPRVARWRELSQRLNQYREETFAEKKGPAQAATLSVD